MSQRLGTSLLVLAVCMSALRSDSAGSAEEPKQEPLAAKRGAANDAGSLLLAVDSLQETLAEQRRSVAETEQRLATERARLTKLEKRLTDLQARMRAARAGRDAKK